MPFSSKSHFVPIHPAAILRIALLTTSALSASDALPAIFSGDLNSWNDAKRAEERDRVKHGIDETPEDNPALGDPDDQPASNDEAVAFADEPVDKSAVIRVAHIDPYRPPVPKEWADQERWYWRNYID